MIPAYEFRSFACTIESCEYYKYILVNDQLVSGSYTFILSNVL